MATWKTFSAATPELASFGAQRLANESGVAYLATVRADGSPRVHPVTPIINESSLFLFMDSTSPKSNDLRRDGRYALHCAVEDMDGGAGEFVVSGKATLIDDEQIRTQAIQAAGYAPKERYILFELMIEASSSTVYSEHGILRQQWAGK
jgi:hypothetical protein